MKRRLFPALVGLALLISAASATAGSGDERIPPECQRNPNCGMWAYLKSQGPDHATFSR